MKLKIIGYDKNIRKVGSLKEIHIETFKLNYSGSMLADKMLGIVDPNVATLLLDYIDACEIIIEDD